MKRRSGRAASPRPGYRLCCPARKLPRPGARRSFPAAGHRGAAGHGAGRSARLGVLLQGALPLLGEGQSRPEVATHLRKVRRRPLGVGAKSSAGGRRGITDGGET